MNTQPSIGRRVAAFTLTEIALCIAVIGIALTAIIGVLPSGLNVQRQNREDTLIAQDAQFLMESIRGGALAIGDLTNQVEYIVWRRRGAVTSEDYFRGPTFTESLPGSPMMLTEPWQVTALLSVPRYEVTTAGVVENEVVAQFRCFSGPFTEKSYKGAGGLPDPARTATALRYLVSVDSQSGPSRPPLVLRGYTNTLQSNIVARQQLQLDRSLNEMRLTFQWPVFRIGNDIRTGNNRRTFRSTVMADRQVLTTNFMGTRRPVFRFNGGRTNAPKLIP